MDEEAIEMTRTELKLQAEINRLKKDRDRLAWAEYHPDETLKGITDWWSSTPLAAKTEFFPLRAIIDSARDRCPYKEGYA